MRSRRSPIRFLSAVAAVFALTVCAATARAQAFSLTDGGSRLDVDVTDPILSQTLTIDGVSISGESGYSVLRYFTRYLEQPRPNELTVLWGFPRFFVGVDYRLEDGPDAARTASLTERLWMANSYTDTDIRCFGYSRYNLSGAEGPADQAVVRPGNVIEQSGPLGTLSVSTNAVKSHYEIGAPARLLETLSGGAPDLTDTPRPGVPFPTVPGDLAFAFEWHQISRAGPPQTIAITTKRFTLTRPPDAVPEPGTLALLGAAGLSLASGRRRRVAHKGLLQ